MTHICIIGSDSCLSPGRHQAIIWTNAGILLIRPLGTNLNEILIEIHIISLKKIHLKMSSWKWRPFCLGLNVLNFIAIGSQDSINNLSGYSKYWFRSSVWCQAITWTNGDPIHWCIYASICLSVQKSKGHHFVWLSLETSNPTIWEK